MKNKKALIEELSSTAAMYAYEHQDENFEITVSIRARDGWTEVTEVEDEK